MSFTNGIMALLERAAIEWGPRPIVVAAGRNFEIEERLVALGCEVISWGDSLYEWAYGRYASHQPFDLRLNPEVLHMLPFLPTPPDDLGKIALLVQSGAIRDAFHDPVKLDILREQWDGLYARSREYVMTRSLHLLRYLGPDTPLPAVSQSLYPPAYVYVPSQVNLATEEIFISSDWKTAFSHASFDRQVENTVRSAYPYFRVSTLEEPDKQSELVGRLMLGAESRWVYSSHGGPAVVREDRPRTELLDAFDPAHATHWFADVKPITFATFGAYYERHIGRKLPERVVRQGQAYVLLLDGQVVGGWCARLMSEPSTIVDAILPFAACDYGLDLVEEAIHSLDARLLYESHYAARVYGVRYKDDSSMYAQLTRSTPLELAFYVADWRNEYYS